MAESDRVPLSGRTPFTPDGPAPTPETLPDGQKRDHWVLPEAERAKGFVRPVRRSYQHVGIRPTRPTRPLTADEHQRYDKYGYVAFEPGEPGDVVLGRFWTAPELKGGCGVVTTMPQAIAETFARDPSFYGSGFCCGCGGYFQNSEFVWEGTEERVGS